MSATFIRLGLNIVKLRNMAFMAQKTSVKNLGVKFALNLEFCQQCVKEAKSRNKTLVN